MLQVKPCDDATAKTFCEAESVEYINGVTTLITATENNETLGSLVYDILGNKMVIKYIEPVNDLLLSDGILRSALFIAANKSIMDIYFINPVPYELIDKLGFVKKKEDNSIDVTNLFSSCKSCKKP